MKPLLPEDAQAAPGYYRLPDNVLVWVRQSSNGRTYALRYWPTAPAEAGPPWVYMAGGSRALAHLKPMRARDAVRAAARLMVPTAA